MISIIDGCNRSTTLMFVSLGFYYILIVATLHLLFDDQTKSSYLIDSYSNDLYFEHASRIYLCPICFLVSS